MVMRRVGTFVLAGGVLLAAPLFGGRLFGTGVPAKASANAAPSAPSTVSVKRSKADDLYLAKPEAAETAYKAIVSEHSAKPDRKSSEEVAIARMRLGYLAGKRGDFAEARAQFLAVQAQPQTDTKVGDEFGGIQDQAAYQAAVCLSAEGKTEEAKQALLTFLGEYKLSPLVHGAYRRLEKLSNGDAGADALRLLQRAVTAQESRARFEAAVCGPKLLVELARRLGKPEPQYEALAKVCGTTNDGTTIEGMLKGLASIGMPSSALVVNREDFAKLPAHSIWLNGPHYLLLLEVKGVEARVYDPSKRGERTLRLPFADDPEFQAPVISLRPVSSTQGARS